MDDERFGPIVGQLESIFEDDTIKSLYYRIEKLGIKLLRKYIPIIATGTVKLKQDESKRTTFLKEVQKMEKLIGIGT